MRATRIGKRIGSRGPARPALSLALCLAAAGIPAQAAPPDAVAPNAPAAGDPAPGAPAGGAPGRAAVLLFVTEYRSPSGLGPEYYSFEEPFVRALPDYRLSLGPREGAAGSIVLRLACDPITQMTMNGKKYELFVAKLRVKLALLAPDGTIAYAKDFEVAKGMGSDANKAEIDALAAAKKALSSFLQEGAEDLAGALGGVPQ